MKPGELRPGVNVADELQRDRLVRRVRAAEKAIQDLLNATAYYNRLHPDQPPIGYDRDGVLEGASAQIGLDWSAMVAKAERLKPSTCAICERTIDTGFPLAVTGTVVCASCMGGHLP